MSQFFNQSIITGDKLSTTTPTQWDNTTITVTSTGVNKLSQGFAIYGNDAVPGTVYRLQAWGTGTQATTTAIVPNWFLLAFNTNNYMNTEIAASQFTAGGGFFWNWEAYILITAVGSSGSFLTWGRVGSDTNGATLVNGYCAQAMAATTVDTTQKWFMQCNFGWASTTNSPTITCTGSYFQRMVYY